MERVNLSEGMRLRVCSSLRSTFWVDSSWGNAIQYVCRDAFDSYATLTIGDGLVSQIPALIISVAAGIAVTRLPAESKLSIDLQTQIFSNVQALYVVAAVLFAFALIPGLPVFHSCCLRL